MMIMRITPDDSGDQDWAAALPGQAAPMQQHPRYGRALSLLGADVRRLAIAGEAGEMLGRAQIATRRFGPLALSMIGRGPLWHGPQAGGQQRAALRQIARGVGPLIAIPGAAEGVVPRGPGLIALMTPAHHAVLDLCPGPAILRAGLGGKWRNRLVRAEAEGVRITRARDFGWLLAAGAAQARARGYRSLPARFTKAWAAAGEGGAAGDDGGCRLYEAHAGGARIAAMLFLVHRPWASYHIGWSGEAGRRRNAHGLILWRAITDLAAEGLAALDLGSVDTEAAPGLARFKIGTGARVAPIGPTLLVLPALTRRRC